MYVYTVCSLRVLFIIHALTCPPTSRGLIDCDSIMLQDPKRRADALRTVRNNNLRLAGPFPLVQGGQGLLARYPVFVDGPIANRTEAFGVDDAYECNELCYGDAARPFWGFTVALVDADQLLAGSFNFSAQPDDVCVVLSRPGPDGAIIIAQTPSCEDLAGGGHSRHISQRIPVVLPNTEWALYVTMLGSCAPWLAPVGVISSLFVLGLVLVAMYALRLHTTNSILHEGELDRLRLLSQQRMKEQAAASSDIVCAVVEPAFKVILL